MTLTRAPRGRASPGAVVDRIEALRALVAAAGPYLPEGRLARARAVIDRAGERLALSREHTVVALAGATGSGKSSLFNALAGLDLSPVGLRRPTTGAAHACVWGEASAGDLLDWLAVPGSRRFRQPDAPGLDGLILLDLPDFDSVERSHRTEVDRLLELVDVVVWVLDPQKYADRVVHAAYLAQFRRHRDITVVVLNQADRLDPADVERCLTDLRRLLAADGLDGAPTFSTSAVGPPGLAPLRETLERAVAAREAALRRLGADVDGVVEALSPIMSAPAGSAEVDPVAVRELIDALARAGGVPVVAAATRQAYVHRARRSTGWPVLRWTRRLRPDPLGRFRLGGRTTPAAVEGGVAPIGASSLPAAAPAAQAGLGLAVRAMAERTGAGLPEPWPAAVLAAARSRLDDVPDALDVAITRTDLGVAHRPFWWRVVGFLHWVAVIAAAAGLAWLAVRYVLFALALPEPPLPAVGRVPLPTFLLVGGLLAGLLLSLVTRPVVAIIARRKARRAEARMRAAVAGVGDALVVAPVREVRHSYAEARAALTRAL